MLCAKGSRCHVPVVSWCSVGLDLFSSKSGCGTDAVYLCVVKLCADHIWICWLMMGLDFEYLRFQHWCGVIVCGDAVCELVDAVCYREHTPSPQTTTQHHCQKRSYWKSHGRPLAHTESANIEKRNAVSLRSSLQSLQSLRNITYANVPQTLQTLQTSQWASQ